MRRLPLQLFAPTLQYAIYGSQLSKVRQRHSKRLQDSSSRGQWDQRVYGILLEKFRERLPYDVNISRVIKDHDHDHAYDMNSYVS